MIVAHKNSDAEVEAVVHVIVSSYHDVGGSSHKDEFALGFAVSDSVGREIDRHLLTMKEYGEYMVTAQSRSPLVIADRSERVAEVEVEQMDGHDSFLGRKLVKRMSLIPVGHSLEMDVWWKRPVEDDCSLASFVEAALLVLV